MSDDWGGIVGGTGVIGAISVASVALDRMITSRRAGKTDQDATRAAQIAALISDALMIADRHRADEHECREKLDIFEAKIAVLTVAVAECERKHAETAAALSLGEYPRQTGAVHVPAAPDTGVDSRLRSAGAAIEQRLTDLEHPTD